LYNLSSLFQANSISDKGFKKVLYPRPSTLFSLKIDDKHKAMNETKMESWLSEIIKKHDNFMAIYNQDFKKSALKEFPVGSEKYITSHITYWKKQAFTKEPIVESITSFFEHTHKHLKKDKKLERHNELFLDAIHVSLGYLSKSDWSIVEKIIAVSQEYFMKNNLFIRLLESTFCVHLQLLKNPSTNHSPLTDLCSIYKETLKTPLSDKSILSIASLDVHGIQISAPANIHLLFIDRSPLTSHLLRLDPDLMESSTEDNSNDKFLQDPDYRAGLIYELYPYLKLSWLKAKVAFTLGMNELEKGDMEKAQLMDFR